MSPRIPAVLLIFSVSLLGVASAQAGRRCARRAAVGPPACQPAFIVVAAETPAQAIRRVLDNQVRAWNRGDLEGFMEGYWKSPTLTFSSGGDQTTGWQATLARYRKRYQGEGREMGNLSFSDITVEVLSPDSAFVRGRWQLVRSKDRPGGLFTLIFRRFPEGWRIVHDHTSH